MCRMARNFLLLVFACLLVVQKTRTYGITDRLVNKISKTTSTTSKLVHALIAAVSDDRESLLDQQISYVYSTIDQCIAVDAIRELGCSLTFKAHPFYLSFVSLCERHRLCFACVSDGNSTIPLHTSFSQGFVHGISKAQCNQLTEASWNNTCAHHTSSPSHCRRSYRLAAFVVQQDVYRSSIISPECYNPCVYEYISSD